MKFIRMFDFLFHTPSAEQLAVRELQEAKRELLLAQSGVEYATNMVRYHQARIDRLKRVVSDSTKQVQS